MPTPSSGFHVFKKSLEMLFHLATGFYVMISQRTASLFLYILYYAVHEIVTSCLLLGAVDPADCVLHKDTDFVVDIGLVPQDLFFFYLFIENFIKESYIYTILPLFPSVPPMFVSSHSFSNAWLLIL